MEEPSWTFPFNTDEQNQYKLDELRTSDALLLGRVTYEGFAASWPKVTNKVTQDVFLPDDFADRMNNYPKYVVSSTLQEVSWNNSRLIRGNLLEGVTKLKQQPGKNILVAGSSQLVDALMQYDLVDEYRLMVFPVVLGKGKRLFNENIQKGLQHVETRTFRSGVVVLTYRPKPLN